MTLQPKTSDYKIILKNIVITIHCNGTLKEKLIGIVYANSYM